MGGKSTLLRQTCLAVILAQIGCYVPAKKCVLTPVDRIFTRLGASDRILEGKSTFFVEMEETNNILKFATFKSLAIIDELGRGTSTFDGFSIACAVLHYLVDNLKCRSLFSTHYHMLLEQFRNFRGVRSYHMACKAYQSSEDNDQQNEVPDEDCDRITFLYKFIEGECPRSFGMNVARMAGLPPVVLQNAKLRSKDFSYRMNQMLNPQPQKVSPKKEIRKSSRDQHQKAIPKKGILKKSSIQKHAEILEEASMDEHSTASQDGHVEQPPVVRNTRSRQKL